MTVRTYIALFFLSAAALAFEILLLRVFAIQEFTHFAYMAITVALLGFGASGTGLALLRDRVAGRESVLFRWIAAAAAVAFLVVPRAAARVPFEPTFLIWEPGQWLYLALLYLLLALPFLFAGGAVALAFLWLPERTPGLYAANMLGSGAGAGLALAAMTVLAPPRLALAPLAAAALGAAAVWFAPRAARFRTGAALLLLALPVLDGLAPAPRLQVTEYKGLPQALAYPDATVTGERSGPLGWTVAVQASAYRYAPGLSLGFTGAVPDQVGLFVDGVAAGAATRWEGRPDRLEFLDWLGSALPYVIVRPERVAVLGSAGGLEVLNALIHGARRVDAVELNPDLIALAESQLDAASSAYGAPGVVAVAGDARAFMESRGGARYDVIQLAGLQPFGAAAGGVYAVSEDYLHTEEAFRAYLRRLAPGGVLAVTRWLRSPARDGLKLLATAEAALRGSPGDPAERIVFLRSWATGTLLVKPDGFERGELARLRSFARSRLLDAGWYPGVDTADVNRFNELETPIYHRAARALFAGPDEWRAFRDDYPFVLETPTDDRPYFSHFLELASVPRLLRMAQAGWAPFAEWGYLVVLATLVQAIVVTALLTLLPAALAGPRRGLADGRWRWVVPYFGAIGLGYLFVEIAAIQKLQLFLGHPVYAVLAVLAAFLLYSGLGSWWLAPRFRRRPWLPAVLVGVLAPLYIALFPLLYQLLAPAPLVVRGLVAAVTLLPLAGVMGAPFPAGLRVAAGADRSTIPWAWAVNGYASVIAVSLAGLLAIEHGFRVVIGAAALLYLVAGLALRWGGGGLEAPERTGG